MNRRRFLKSLFMGSAGATLGAGASGAFGHQLFKSSIQKKITDEENGVANYSTTEQMQDKYAQDFTRNTGYVVGAIGGFIAGLAYR